MQAVTNINNAKINMFNHNTPGLESNGTKIYCYDHLIRYPEGQFGNTTPRAKT